MKLGDRVICKAYLKKVYDGVFIQKIEGNLTESGEDIYVLHPRAEKHEFFSDPFGDCVFRDKEKEAEEILSPCEGAYDLEKTYYERKEKRFDGFVVGVKDIISEGYLGVDTCTDWRGCEYRRIFKDAKTTIKCALVYYALGKSRLVPLDDLEVEHGNKS